jgi:hypothetical protein
MGLLPGMADLVIVMGGRAHFLEIKSKGGRPSSDQIAFRSLCGHAGSRYAVVDDLDAALGVLRSWGALRQG